MINPKTLNKIKKIMGSEYSSKSRSEKVKITKNLINLFNDLKQKINLHKNIRNMNERTWYYSNIKLETILKIFSKFNLEVSCKDVIYEDCNHNIIINLKDGEHLCPKCDGIGSIKLYVFSTIPVDWSYCWYCSGIGKMAFTDIIKKGLSK